MTAAQLVGLSPRQRQVMELRLAGHTQATVADMLKLKRSHVPHLEYEARKRLRFGPPKHPRAPTGSPTCIAGHPRPPGKQCRACERIARKGRRVARLADEESSAVAFVGVPTAKRIAIEIAQGKRCGHKMLRGPCGLLLPCVHP